MVVIEVPDFSVTSAILLRRVNFQDTDRILTFLTKDYGIISCIARGVRKQKSKLAGGLELFSESEIRFLKRDGGLYVLTSARIKKYYGNIVKDLDKTDVCYYALKKVNKLVEESNGSEYYALLKELLVALDDKSSKTDLVKASFDMHFSRTYGSLPDFLVDNKGSRLMEADNFSFNFDKMVFYPDPNGSFNKNHIKTMRVISVGSMKSISMINGIGKHVEDLASVIEVLSVN